MLNLYIHTADKCLYMYTYLIRLVCMSIKEGREHVDGDDLQLLLDGRSVLMKPFLGIDVCAEVTHEVQYCMEVTHEVQ